MQTKKTLQNNKKQHKVALELTMQSKYLCRVVPIVYVPIAMNAISTMSSFGRLIIAESNNENENDDDDEVQRNENDARLNIHAHIVCIV